MSAESYFSQCVTYQIVIFHVCFPLFNKYLIFSICLSLNYLSINIVLIWCLSFIYINVMCIFAKFRNVFFCFLSVDIWKRVVLIFCADIMLCEIIIIVVYWSGWMHFDNHFGKNLIF